MLLWLTSEASRFCCHDNEPLDQHKITLSTKFSNAASLAAHLNIHRVTTNQRPCYQFESFFFKEVQQTIQIKNGDHLIFSPFE
ncbi:CLUMA_CG017319, isoform A [Clunio marinus]|uniref:CLUMA_CG017319, isoform A n=1 Tax=Clunio marinus TaxID=568069 RepID=A0A1J1IVJ0_9DIPT|nr:CLUMA_CG017319, isoform A [Clunio marinus]